MKRFLYLLALSFSYFSLAAQSHEWDQWRFLDSCSISFTSTGPVNAQACQITSYGAGAEGSASIADRNGNLICYTSGQALWDKNDNLTPNGTGLKGHISSVQSSIILPLPGDTNIYYIFTSSAAEDHGDSGYCYSIYDRRLNGGLGDITSTKNVKLYGPSTEGLAATHNARHTGYWIVTHPLRRDSLVVYGLSDTGLTGPVYSIMPHDTSYYGGISFSPDGRRVALNACGPGRCLVGDIDPLTGSISGLLTINTGTYGNENNYFTCFSPSSNMLYVTDIYHGRLTQFDVSSRSAAAIIASRYTVYDSARQLAVANMQPGPDGRIYVARYLQFYLGVITAPDLPGAACGYISNGFYLGGRRSWIGLPAMVCSAFAPPLCTTTTTPINGAICVDVPYIFHGRSLSSPGIYRDTFQTYYGCDSIIVLNLTIQQAPPVMLSLRPLVQRGSLHVSDADTFVCAGDPSFLLTGGYPLGGSYSGAAVTGSRYTPPAISGTSAISYTYTDTTGCAALSRKVIQVRDCTTGIDDLTAASAINVYPEPSDGIFTLHTSLTPGSYYLIRDLSGRIIQHSAIAQEDQRIDLSDKASGTYLLTVISEDRAETVKVTVVK